MLVKCWSHNTNNKSWEPSDVSADFGEHAFPCLSRFFSLQGHGDDSDNNFIQLLRVRASDCPDILAWLDKKTNNYVSPVMKNQYLRIMCQQLLWQVSSCIQKSHLYFIAADECTDSSNKEQFTVCICWVDESLVDREDFIGQYEVPSTDSDTLGAAIKDVLLRMSLSLSDCREQ